MFSSARRGAPAATRPTRRTRLDPGMPDPYSARTARPHHLQGPPLGAAPADVSHGLQSAKVPLDRRGRREADGRADLSHGRRIALLPALRPR